MMPKFSFMTIPNLSETVVVFDLDDTLYSEDYYNESGVIAVCEELKRLYGTDIKKELLVARIAKVDIWEKACLLLALPLSVKESLIWLYRLHHPSINLDKVTLDVFHNIKKSAKHVAILTDGRSITQRQKLLTLGLLNFSLYISEEHSSEKPDLMRFEQLMNDLPAENYVYIGDNPKKDFIAPNKLGWQTIGLKGGGGNIHSQEVKGLPLRNLPNNWVGDISEVVDLIAVDI